MVDQLSSETPGHPPSHQCVSLPLFKKKMLKYSSAVFIRCGLLMIDMLQLYTRHAIASCLCCLAPMCLIAQISRGRPMPPVVWVNVDTTGSMGKVSPSVFGTFIEPIDLSINNGVMAEILVNGSLESGHWNHAMLEAIFENVPELIQSTNRTGIPMPLQALYRSSGNRYELQVGRAANSWQSLEVIGAPGELTGIKQRVYLPVPRAWKHKASLYAKHLDGPTTLEVSLRDHSAARELKVLGSAQFDAPLGSWKKYTASVELKPGSVKRLEPVEFAISVEGIRQSSGLRDSKRFRRSRATCNCLPSPHS